MLTHLTPALVASLASPNPRIMYGGTSLSAADEAAAAGRARTTDDAGAKPSRARSLAVGLTAALGLATLVAAVASSLTSPPAPAASSALALSEAAAPARSHGGGRGGGGGDDDDDGDDDDGATRGSVDATVKVRCGTDTLALVCKATVQFGVNNSGSVSINLRQASVKYVFAAFWSPPPPAQCKCDDKQR